MNFSKAIWLFLAVAFASEANASTKVLSCAGDFVLQRDWSTQGKVSLLVTRTQDPRTGQPLYQSGVYLAHPYSRPVLAQTNAMLMRKSFSGGIEFYSDQPRARIFDLRVAEPFQTISTPVEGWLVADALPSATPVKVDCIWY